MTNLVQLIIAEKDNGAAEINLLIRI